MPNRPKKRGSLPIVGIVASAGGLDAFKKFLSHTPVPNGIAFVLVPHLDTTHKSLMVELLARQTKMPVQEAMDGMIVEANSVYIIPPNHGLSILNGALKPAPLAHPPESSASIDQFLRSLADDQGELAIGIVLSGTGSHGSLGIREIKRCGGMAMAQSPDTAEFPQMPNSAIETGLIDFVLPPQVMPETLLRYVAQPYLNRSSHLISQTGNAADQLQEIIRLIHLQTRMDFRSYRPNMLLRRIERRMGLLNLQDLGEYVSLLQQDPTEVTTLSQNFLISVTAFFREPEAFAVLERELFPWLVLRHGNASPIRVWVPSCATGEEAYTLAILLFEAHAKAGVIDHFQIFASDVSEQSIAVARRGVYPSSIANDISPERLAKYFVTHDATHFRVSKKLRDSIVFATQNLVTDAPFSRLDLISCRNLLIYLQLEMQSKLLSLFHYALVESGYLLLGPSESIGRSQSDFEPISKKWRVFRRIGSTNIGSQTAPWRTKGRRVSEASSTPPSPPRKSYQELTERLILTDYAPAAALINSRFEILYVSGPLANYLEFPAGELSKDVLAMARPELRRKLQALYHQAQRDKLAKVDSNARVKRNGHYFNCTLTVRPLMGTAPDELSLVLFQDHPMSILPSPTVDLGGHAHPPETPPFETPSLIQMLEMEVKAAREELQGTVEEMESSNEELQSSNEELESSKEELQSLNEELSIVNVELEDKITELALSNSDLFNLMASTEIATLFLDRSLRIKRFSPACVPLFHLVATDEGRFLHDFASSFVEDEMLEDCKQVLAGAAIIEKELFTEGQSCYLRRILPFRTADLQTDGVVITLLDITERKRREAKQREKDQLYREIFEHAATGIAIANLDGSLEHCNPAFCDLLDYSADSLRQSGYWSKLHPDDLNKNRLALQRLQAGEVPYFELENRYLRSDGQTVWGRKFASILPNETGEPAHFVMLVTDITERKQAEQKLQESAQVLQLVVDTVPHYIYAKNQTGGYLLVNQYTASQNGFASPKEMLEQDTIHHEENLNHAALNSEDLAVLSTGIPWNVPEETLVNASGMTRVVQTSKLLFRLPGSNEPALLGVSVDITDRKHAELKQREGAERIRAILNAASDAIITITNGGLIDSVNRATEAMFGFTSEELVGTSISLLIPLESGLDHESYIERFSDLGEAVRQGIGREIICNRKDRTTFPADLVVSQVDHLGLFTGFIRDISLRRDMQKHILEIAADEQRRIGLELHDGTQQELTGLTLYASALIETIQHGLRRTEGEDTRFEFQSESYQRLVDTAALLSKRLVEANQHVRDLAHGIMPVQIDAEGLRSALGELATSISSAGTVHCCFESHGELSLPNNTTATHLYRIAQEAVNNAVRHGDADEIVITLSQEQSKITLDVSDNGCGWESSESESNVPANHGMGLRTMEYRANLLGGVMQFLPRPEGGTQVRCSVLRGGALCDE